MFAKRCMVQMICMVHVKKPDSSEEKVTSHGYVDGKHDEKEISSRLTNFAI